MLQLWYKHTFSSLITWYHSVCFPLSSGPVLVFSIGTQHTRFLIYIYNKRWCHFCLSLPCRAKGHLTGESRYDWELLSSLFFLQGNVFSLGLRGSKMDRGRGRRNRGRAEISEGKSSAEQESGVASRGESRKQHFFVEFPERWSEWSFYGQHITQGRCMSPIF